MLMIKLSPQVREGALAMFRDDRALIINGKRFDLLDMADQEEAGSEWIISVRAIEGDLHVTVLYPITGDASEAQRFPAPIIDPADGPVPLPA